MKLNVEAFSRSCYEKHYSWHADVLRLVKICKSVCVFRAKTNKQHWALGCEFVIFNLLVCYFKHVDEWLFYGPLDRELFYQEGDKRMVIDD